MFSSPPPFPPVRDHETRQQLLKDAKEDLEVTKKEVTKVVKQMSGVVSVRSIRFQLEMFCTLQTLRLITVPRFCCSIQELEDAILEAREELAKPRRTVNLHDVMTVGRQLGYSVSAPFGWRVRLSSPLCFGDMSVS